ncbi:putative asparagine--tRNA ligase [Helianthus debilis subsp. tardiflorus]
MVEAAITSAVNNLKLSDTIPKHEFSQRVLIQTILTCPDGSAGLDNQTLKVGGWVRKWREQGKGTFAFIELNSGSCPGNLQLIIHSDVGPLGQFTPTSTCLHVEVVLQMSPEDKQGKQVMKTKMVKVLDVGSVDPCVVPPEDAGKPHLTAPHLHIGFDEDAWRRWWWLMVEEKKWGLWWVVVNRKVWSREEEEGWDGGGGHSINNLLN